MCNICQIIVNLFICGSLRLHRCPLPTSWVLQTHGCWWGLGRKPRPKLRELWSLSISPLAMEIGYGNLQLPWPLRTPRGKIWIQKLPEKTYWSQQKSETGQSGDQRQNISAQHLWDPTVGPLNHVESNDFTWSLRIYACIYIYIRTHTHMHTHSHTYIYIFIYMYIFCLYMYICTYIFIYKKWRSRGHASSHGFPMSPVGRWGASKRCRRRSWASYGMPGSRGQNSCCGFAWNWYWMYLVVHPT